MAAAPELAATSASEAPTRFDRVLSVLGMHRSGTSAFTRVLNLLGAGIGPAEDLIPPAPDNPRGFWEHRPLVLVNDRLLGVLGGTWDAPPPLTPGWHLRPTLRALESTIGRRFDVLASTGHDVVVWKDPRVCLLGPLWDAVLGRRTDDHRKLHVVRAPDEVCGSLMHRNGLSSEHAARLWVRYVRDALASAPEAARFDQAELHRDLPATIARLVDVTGLESPDETTWTAIESFLDIRLQTQRHHRCPDGGWMDVARAVHEALVGGREAAAIVAWVDDASARLHPDEERPARLAVVGTGCLPDAVTSARPDPRSGATLVWPAATWRDRYSVEALGWRVDDLATAAVPDVLEPDTILCCDAQAVIETINAAVSTRPLTRLATLDTVPNRGLVDVVVAPGEIASLLDRDLPPVRPGRPAIGRIGPTRQRPGVVSVVIPVHGNWELTERCLDRLGEHATRPLEVVVVDDASPDDTAHRLERREDVDVVVTNDRNVGFPAAANAGLRATSGEYVCILNNDTEVTSGWLDTLLGALTVAGTGLVGPRTNRISGPQQIPGAPSFHDVGSDRLQQWAQDVVSGRPDVSWLTSRLVGFCLLARRDLFERLGGFDEGVGLGNFEDDELCARVRTAGLTCRVAERAVVLHHGSGTFAHTSDAHARSMLQGARHTYGRLRHDADGVTAVVLADGCHDLTRRSAHAALALCDAVQIWEAADAMATTRALAGSPPRVSVQSVAWAEDPAAMHRAARAILGQRLVVLRAGERLMARDVGTARHELETSPHGGISLGVGAEQRLVASSADVANVLGAPAGAALEHVWVEP